MGKKSLADELLELSTPQNDFDIEDDEFVTRDESDGSEGEESDEFKTDHYVSVGKSKLRTNEPRNVYGGQVSSRDQIFGEDGHVSGSHSEGSESEEEVEQVGSEQEGSEQDSDSDEQEAFSIDGADDDSESETESINKQSEDDSHKRDQLNSFISKERQTISKRIAQSNTTDALKGYSVLNQNKLFDSLIDSRIKLQKALTKSNTLPSTPEISEQFKTDETDSNIERVKDQCFDLLDSILKLRNNLHKKDDLPSVPLPKKRKIDNYFKATAELDNNLGEFRTNVLNKWSKKVQSSSGSNALNAGKFKVVNQSAEQQVINNLNDIERLKKRTYLNRSSISPLGYKDETETNEDEDEENPDIPKQVIKKDKNEIKQIFDDEDFYRLLLNDLVDKKIASSNPINGVTLSLRQSQKAQKANKNVDTRATKGRKLKFNVQDPIAHFETPISLKWDDNQIDEFFASLLGQKINMAESDDDMDDEEEEIVAEDSIKLFS